MSSCAEIAAVAVNKPSNSDVYTVPMARFVETFARVLGDQALPHLFFIDGGALAVENALKVAFDWKSRLNESRGIDPALGTKVLHLERAFHGRSGYTLSLTNTDPARSRGSRSSTGRASRARRSPCTATRPPWPRPKPKRSTRPAAPSRRTRTTSPASSPSRSRARAATTTSGPSFLRAMQALCREFDALFIFDEVQTGFGLTGTAWAHQQLGLSPTSSPSARRRSSAA